MLAFALSITIREASSEILDVSHMFADEKENIGELPCF